MEQPAAPRVLMTTRERVWILPLNGEVDNA